MTRIARYPRERLDRVPAVVFACLLPGELRIVVHPGLGLANGGVQWDVPAGVIPPELRMPNTPLWLQLDDGMNIVRVWRREEPLSEAAGTLPDCFAGWHRQLLLSVPPLRF
jgi:hypothetical protein